jgi:uncharacterized protein DUF4440
MISGVICTRSGPATLHTLKITHPADRILVLEGAALVTGRMTATVLVEGTIVHVDNRYLAVWVREHGVWKFVAYQPTPIIKG